MKTRNMARIASSIRKKSAEFINFSHGLDIVTPPINAKPGSLRDSLNWIVDTSGDYERIAGYERIDGRSKPSESSYSILDVTITGSIEVGDTITGDVSGHTGVVIAVVTTTTPDYLVLTKTTGVFSDGEDLDVSAVKEGEAIGTAAVDSADTALLNAQYANLAADDYRDDITAVTGSSAIRGVFVLDDVIYAFRDNAGATSCDLWKSSSSGWTQVAYKEEISFTGGNNNVGEGDTLTQGGVTATIDRYIYLTGTSPNNQGRLVISGRSGGNFASGAATSTGGGVLTLSGVQTAITMSAGGRFEIIIQNFGGALGTKRAYGCDGVNRGWEFDGSTFTPITTGAQPTDAPEHCIEHKYHLFFSFGSSAQHSGTAEPYIWDPVYGASGSVAEIAVGDDITGFSQEGGGSLGEGALAIISRNKTHILYGSNTDDWQLVPYRDELGGYPWSIQQIGPTILVDDRGITSLITSDKYGNFEHGTLSRNIRPWINERRQEIVASCISREKSQYRLFFNGGVALYSTFEGLKILGMMPQTLSHEISCAWSSELNDGTEIILFGGNNGYVYEMDKGTSFDGDLVEHFINLHYIHFDTPHIEKEFYGGFFEASGDGYAEFSFTYELGYGSSNLTQPDSVTKTVEVSTASWGSFTWDTIYWDGQSLIPSTFELEGRGENISLIISGESDYDSPIKISGALIEFVPSITYRYNNV